MKQKPQLAIDPDVFALLKKYCGIKRKKLSHVGSQVIRAFLETEHEVIESEGQMVIEGEAKKPKTIVEILKGE